MFWVGIPVRNEEKNIKWIVDDIFIQSLKPEEVLICINWTKDRTAEIVQWLQKKYSNIKLLESKPWKSNAWNKIKKESNNKLMVFCDGDIRLWWEDTFKKLLDDFTKKDLSMLWWSIIQVPSTRKTPYKLKTPSWQLYAIDLEKLNLDEMPEDIINEDLFLTLKTFPNVEVTQDAFFYSNKPNYRDIYHTQLRILKWIKQIVDLWMDDELLKLLEVKKYSKTKVRVILNLMNFVKVKKNDNLWKEPISTKKEIKLN